MSNDAPLVSIGLPVRNGEETIGQVAESVLGQTYRNLEFVIYDNESTDGTEKVCRELARADNRVRYLRHPSNVGLFNNDVAVSHAVRGTFFRLIGDDDHLEPDYVEACLAEFESDPRLVMVTTGIAYVTDDGRVSSEEYSGTGLGSDDPADRVIEMLRLLNESYLQLDPCYGMMRPRIVQIPRRNMLKEDEILAVRFALAGPWGHVPRVLARRTWHDEPVSLARKLWVPGWQARFVNTLQVRELLRHVDEASLTAVQRSRIRAAIYGMFVRRHRRVLVRRSRKLLRLAHLTR
jgi:glycosyltransferase involved in cell wall biosynthesis